MAIEAHIDVAASPSAVNDVLLDGEAAPLWTAGLERIEVVSGVPGEPGCVGRAHYVEGSRRFVLDDRLLEATPRRHFKSEIRGGGLVAVVETDLAEIPSGTRVTIRWAGRGTNPVTRLVLPFMGGRIRRRAQRDLEALRKLIQRLGV